MPIIQTYISPALVKQVGSMMVSDILQVFSL